VNIPHAVLVFAAARMLISGCGEKSTSQKQTTYPADIDHAVVNAKRVADKTIDGS
jgi:hypothetical protein